MLHSIDTSIGSGESGKLKDLRAFVPKWNSKRTFQVSDQESLSFDLLHRVSPTPGAALGRYSFHWTTFGSQVRPELATTPVIMYEKNVVLRPMQTQLWGYVPLRVG